MLKKVRSDNYNYDFDTDNGFFARWGATPKDDPCIAPAPEILDIEVSTICHGIGTPCKFCYKSNTGVGENMTFDTFKKIFDNMPSHLTQIAFGIGDIDSNPDLFKMFDYARNSGRTVIPNVTTNGWKLTDELAGKLKQYCGAVAVSRYNPKDVCYDAVKKLTDLGMKQINIHQLVSKETLDNCMETIADMKTDPRLAKMNAVVFLTLKPKGERNTYSIVSDDDYAKLIDTCLKNKINFGFDSCSANRFLKTANKMEGLAGKFDSVAEPCESTLFSSYINVEGKFFPCSFAEGEGEWKEGLDAVNCKDFLTEIWNHPKTLKFRSDLLMCGRNCPLFKI